MESTAANWIITTHLIITEEEREREREGRGRVEPSTAVITPNQ